MDRRPRSTSLLKTAAAELAVSAAAVRNYPTGPQAGAQLQHPTWKGQAQRVIDYNAQPAHSCHDPSPDAFDTACTQVGAQVFANVTTVPPDKNPHENAVLLGGMNTRFKTEPVNANRTDTIYYGGGPSSGQPHLKAQPPRFLSGSSSDVADDRDNHCPTVEFGGKSMQMVPSKVYKDVHGGPLCMLEWQTGSDECSAITCNRASYGQGQVGTGITPPSQVTVDWACRSGSSAPGDFSHGTYDIRHGCTNFIVDGRGMNDAKPSALLTSGTGMYVASHPKTTAMVGHSLG